LLGCGFTKVGSPDLSALLDLSSSEMSLSDLSSDDIGPPRPLRVFVTSYGFPGDMNAATGNVPGVAGGDALCQGRADAYQLGGIWRAWLSDSTTAAIDHIQGNGPFYRLDGPLLFADHAALAGDPRLPISVSEDGNGPIENPVWTGTAFGGVLWVVPELGNGDCDEWTSRSGAGGTEIHLGHNGDNSKSNGQWTSASTFDVNCSLTAGLYCFEQ
jgi:hypothetical protein